MQGMSGVIVAVLLTVIGILAVLLFWGMFSGMLNPQPKVIIEKATITKIGSGVYDVAVTVREVGGASTTIKKIEIKSDETTISVDTSSSLELSAGQSKTIIGTASGTLLPGKTYYIYVFYIKGNEEERSDLYPVTVR